MSEITRIEIRNPKNIKGKVRSGFEIIIYHRRFYMGSWWEGSSNRWVDRVDDHLVLMSFGNQTIEKIFENTEKMIEYFKNAYNVDIEDHTLDQK